MNDNIEFLQHIYQNSEMGTLTINQLLDIVEDANFIEQLETQYDEYKDINTKAKDLLKELGVDEKGISGFQKMRANVMMNIQTLTDKSSSNIAEMLIIGSNMGVINAIKNLNRYINCDLEICELMQKLKSLEEKNIENLKAFL